MSDSKQAQFEFVNQVGYEAFQLIIKRMEALGSLTFSELLPSVVGAATVCLANVLRPAVEAASNKAQVADTLVAQSAKQTRILLEPVVANNNTEKPH